MRSCIRCRILVAPIIAGDGTLSNGTGFPAVTFAGGFSTPTASAPLGVPVGAELLGLDYSEAKLLAYAYAFEQASQLRKPAPQASREHTATSKRALGEDLPGT